MVKPIAQKPTLRFLRDLLLKILKGKELIPGMTDIKAGRAPNEIVFKTSEGDVLCQIEEGRIFVFLCLPSGKKLALPKQKVEEAQKNSSSA